MSFLDPANVAAAPADWDVLRQVTLWREEAIFGHRLWARQNPWLLFLEFLNVAEAHHRAAALFSQTEPDRMYRYALRYRMGLRSILFSDAGGDALTSSLDGESAWQRWSEEMKDAVDPPPEGFGYVRERFRDFEDFADLVGLVRQSALESTVRRWSSRFIFPFGVNALYSDAITTSGRAARDYNVFGRTGEILYYMVSRASRAAELAPFFEKLFDPQQPKNRLVALLCAPSDDDANALQQGNSFLPYRRHPAFERLVEDWLNVIALGLPGQDAFAHLAPLASLHVLLYQLETAAAWAGKPRPSLICEIIAPRRELVRQRSIASFYDNEDLGRQAANAYVEAVIAREGWPVADDALDDSERLEAARAQLVRGFHYDPKSFDAASPEDLRVQFDQAGDAKYEENWSDVHSAYGRYIGLVSRRATNRYRYAPTDALLKTLVMARVPRRLEFSKFLSDLYVQYGLVLGPEEARMALPETAFDPAAFLANRERLEARLASMGLLKRLSDGCAYVLNPFGAKPA